MKRHQTELEHRVTQVVYPSGIEGKDYHSNIDYHLKSVMASKRWNMKEEKV
jgi:hypothetical protein